MLDNRSSYRQIFKVTSILGGVQVFTIVVSIIKSKFIAILLGAEGMGLLGLFNSTVDLIKAFTGLGLSSSAVRDISEVAITNDQYKISSTLKTLKRWVIFTGIFGSLLTIILSPLLSQWAFGNNQYTWSFVWLSIVIFLHSLSSGQLAAIQGLRRIKDFAKVGLYGAVTGLIGSLCLFYFFELKGIVPSIILTALCTLVFSWHFNRKISLIPIKQTYTESCTNGLQMVKLGIMMMLNGLLTVIASYIFRVFISKSGGVSEVGIYQAGNAIVEGYFGLIYTAMATDYFPRLSAVNKDNLKVKEEVNKQAEIALLIAAPMIVISLLLMPFIIKILYTTNFLEAVSYVKWAVLGNVFKIGSWVLAFVLLAKGESKLVILTAVVFCFFFLFMNILGYKFMGVEGVGIAYCVNYLVYMIGLYILCSRRYFFRYSGEFWKTFFFVMIISTITFILQLLTNSIIKYSVGFSLCVIMCVYCFHKLNSKIGIIQIISSRLKK